MSHDCLSSLTEKGDFCISKILAVFEKGTSYFFFRKVVFAIFTQWPSDTLYGTMR